MTRDPKRLKSFYDELERIHRTYTPDWRFGQFLYNTFGSMDIFYFEEDKILKDIKEYFGEVDEINESEG